MGGYGWANIKKEFEHSFKPEKEDSCKTKKQTNSAVGLQKKILRRLEPKKRSCEEKSANLPLKYLMVRHLITRSSPVNFRPMFFVFRCFSFFTKFIEQV